MNTLPPAAEMRRALEARDAAYDGVFVFAVRSTGIFCRPSCAARKPLPNNVEYFVGSREAVFAGYRPCKRCRPLEAMGGIPEWLRPAVDALEAEPSRRITSEDLRGMRIEPARARRWFLSHHGMTFQAYARARRLGGALARIRDGEPLDDVAVGSGWGSHSGFRDAFGRAFGRTPGRSRGVTMVTTARIDTPLGPMVAGATEEGVCLLEFNDRRMLETQIATVRRAVGVVVPGEHRHLARLREELGEYFAGRLRRFTVPLHTPGTEFQRKVWTALLEIPYGETRSYDDLARSLGSPGASRAVGRANGSNRIAIVVPCHRVVNKDGRLGGYGGGLRRKEFLLALERAAAPEAGLPLWKPGITGAAHRSSDPPRR